MLMLPPFCLLAYVFNTTSTVLRYVLNQSVEIVSNFTLTGREEDYRLEARVFS